MKTCYNNAMDKAVSEASYPITFRQREATELGEHLKHRHCVDLVGLKRVGISNFLRFFLNHEKISITYIGSKHPQLFIPVDLNDLVEREIFPFWVLTFKRIVDAVEQSKLADDVKVRVNGLFSASIQLHDLFLLIENLRRALGAVVDAGWEPTIFFLRFDRLRDVVNPAFFDNLKGLRDATGEQLAYVFTSFRSLTDLFPASKDSLGLVSNILFIPPANKRDMESIYKAYKERYGLKLSVTLEEALFDLIGGHIQYLQLALIILTEQQSLPTSERQLFELIMHDERIALQSEELWEGFTKEEQAVLARVAAGEKINDREKQKTQYLWKTGCIIEQNGARAVFSPLFEMFLRVENRKNDQESQVDLSRKEYLLYNLLEAHVGAICDRDMIIDSVWPEYKELGVSDWAIDRLVARLRVKLREQQSHFKISTIRTRGYKLIPA